MKILLLGDYSSLHVNLKNGLLKLGHQCSLATDGDGYKNTSFSDIPFPRSKFSSIRKIKKLLFPILNLRKFYNFDVVQLINSDIFGGTKYFYNQYIISRIRKHNPRIFLSACGTDSYVYLNRKKLKYNPYDSTIELDLKGKNPYLLKYNLQNNDFVVNLVDKIIPSMYSYSFPYISNTKLSNTIPLPIDTLKYSFSKQIFYNNKITIFHGLNRPGFKGTYYIKEAMERILKKYPDKVEVIIDGNMPIEVYLKLMDKVNIIVDQCLSYDYGMNALYGMAKGKVVLSGNEIESQKHFNRFDIPVINILPSVDDIYSKLEKLILNKDKIIEIGHQSRLYVEDFHDSVKVAKQYLKIWMS